MADADDLVRLTSTETPVEAEMISALLKEHGIQSLFRPSGGIASIAPMAQELFVRADQHARAAEIVDEHFGLR